MTPKTFLELMNVGQSAFVFASGAIVASFWALVAYRVTRNMGWVKGRSVCDCCRHQIAWWQNIPVLSYILLRGRCRYCRARIEVSYFIWELLLGVWTLWWWWQISPLAEYLDATNLEILPPFGSQPGQWLALIQSVLVLALGAVLLWVALVDWQTQTIADGWLWVILGLTVVRLSLLAGTGMLGWQQFGTHLLGSLAIGGAFWLIDVGARHFLGQAGIGLGDTLLVMILAWWLSPVQLVVMFLLSFWLGAIVGVLILIFARLAGMKRQRLTVAFLPFICSAFLLAWQWGEELWTLFV